MRIDEPSVVTLSSPGLAHRDDKYRALMARYQAGDRQAFEGLYERLAPALIAYLDAIAPGLGQDAALIDEVFLAIHRARRTYDTRRPFEPWATAITRHVALSRHSERSHGRRT